MLTRIIIGILLSAAALVFLYVGGFALKAALYLCIALCLFEVYSALKRQSIRISPSAGIFFVLMLPLAIQFYALKGILSLFMVTGMLILAFQVFRADLTTVNTAFTFFTLFYPGMMLSMLPLMLTFPNNGGRWAILFTILIASASDSFALYTGLLIGKHKLSPSISPKKTVEGAIGGLLGGALIGLAIGLYMKSYIYADTYIWQIVLLGLVGSVAGQIGDLTASIIKRSTGIKDFGKIFPGHGGVMDRADSILFVAPIVYCYFSLIVFAS